LFSKTQNANANMFRKLTHLVYSLIPVAQYMI